MKTQEEMDEAAELIKFALSCVGLDLLLLGYLVGIQWAAGREEVSGSGSLSWLLKKLKSERLIRTAHERN